jgi:hypothetical protein
MAPLAGQRTLRSRPNQRMDQPGRGQLFSKSWHNQSPYRRVPRARRAPQVMRGR